MKAYLALGALIARVISALPSNILTERGAAANGTVTYGLLLHCLFSLPNLTTA
jgi:hypothetical protein